MAEQQSAEKRIKGLIGWGPKRPSPSTITGSAEDGIKSYELTICKPFDKKGWGPVYLVSDELQSATTRRHIRAMEAVLRERGFEIERFETDYTIKLYL